MSKIKKLPVNERPRERLTASGAEALSDAELLAIILHTGDTSQSALGLALVLLNKYNIKELSRISPEVLQRIFGIGIAKACQIIASFELGKRAYGYQEKPKPLIESAKDAVSIAVKDFHGLKQEHFFILLVDSRQRLIKKEKVFVGTLNNTIIHPREIFQKAIEKQAAGIILMHNHPSNDFRPSDEDIEITKQVEQAGNLLEIDVLDHIIISDEGYFSFKENNLI